jgi:hypothetical protein
MPDPNPKEALMKGASSGTDRPTPKQLAYLRSLASRSGQTFEYPRSRRQASREIKRLKCAEPSTRAEQQRERAEIADAIHCGSNDAARVRDSEITGYGSSAGWLHNCNEARTPGRNTPPPSARRPNVGQRVELARYTTADGERVINGQRIDAVVRVTDRPANGHGRAYLVEQGLEQDGNAALHALVGDYLAKAQKLGYPPMHGWF